MVALETPRAPGAAPRRQGFSPAGGRSRRRRRGAHSWLVYRFGLSIGGRAGAGLDERRRRRDGEPMAKILLAEDDDTLRQFLEWELGKAGHEVFAVRDGSEALPVLAEGRFDVLVADIVMPEIDGIELARRAGAIDPGLRILFITGFSAVALRSRGARLPEAKVLSKPFHLRVLVDEIDKLMAA